jgi:hypothetical protein
MDLMNEEMESIWNNLKEKGRSLFVELGSESGAHFLKVAFEMGFKNMDEIMVMFATYFEHVKKDNKDNSMISKHGFKMFLTEMILENMELEG